jgi:hypothetical protein
MAADQVEEHVRSAFPEGAIRQVQVLAYGDDPEIGPGQIAIRVFIDQPASSSDVDSGHLALRRFVKSNREAMDKLSSGMPAIAWLDFRLGDAQQLAEDGPAIRTDFARHQTPPDQAAAELTSVMTRLGPEDLATVDTLIVAGIASSRAEVLRWALGRIRAHPAYEQIQARVREISDLKAQF